MVSKQPDNSRSWFYIIPNFLFLYVVWILFVSKFDRQELEGGIIAALVAAVAAQIFQAVGLVKFRPRFADLLQAWRMAGYMFTGSYEILQGLFRQLFTKDGAPSVVLAVPFEVGGDDPQSHARRALAVTYTTITPNFVVLGIAKKSRLLVYHQIIPGPVLQITRNLGARP